MGVLPLVAACVAPPPDPNTRPKSPLTLPLVAADTSFSGALVGRVTQARLERCAARQDGTSANFYPSIYFQLGDQWHYLQLISGHPFSLGATSGYSVPEPTRRMPTFGRHRSTREGSPSVVVPGAPRCCEGRL
ncbi:MAG: hypothetical protein NVSMB23_04300 [Myxococcales bacterium]